ncbi:flavin reductase family protein [Pseudonocardia sp. H11422]|uniref:flavin reductase family protein n=1 Tax=Pseudonocardia sp. H11422 TaxID=2835866 RepID=UPI001BDC0705|nr:flavin reductase family protein [Pseudonocardia sp. H11422]
MVQSEIAAEAGPGREPVAEAAFRAAMTRFASGVTAVTTRDETGRPWGFTASSFCALSLRPPLVLVCLDRGADCHPVFVRSQRFVVNILAADQHATATAFATKAVDKFAAAAFDPDPDAGLPVLAGALASVLCRTSRTHPGGDHTILIGDVTVVSTAESAPLVHFDRGFRALAAEPAQAR